MSESRPPTDPLRDGARTRVTETGITEVGFDDPELRPHPPDRLHYHVPHSDAHPEMHEHSDVPIRPLVITLAAIAGTCVLTCVLLYWVFWHYKSQQDAQELPRTAVPVAKPNVPEPRLQGIPGFNENDDRQDLKDLRAGYSARLNAYGREATGQAAHIPIDRAMDLALERNMFPVAASGDRNSAPPRPQTQPAGQRARSPEQQRGNR